jgi:hypothetical protein
VRHPALSLPLLVCALLAPPAARAAAPRVTIYSHDLAYVQEPRTLTLGGGRDTLRLADVPERIDFSSVRLDVGDRARVERLAYRFDVASGDGLLEHALGRRVRIVSQQRERVSEGVLVSADGTWLTLRGDDGGMIVVARGDVGEIRLADAAQTLSSRPTIEAALQGGGRGDLAATLSYLTGGLSWSAEHRLVRTGETSGRWSTTVTVENTSGREYRDATLRLVAGEPSRTNGMPAPRPILMKAMAAEAAPADMGEQAFSEYHLYTLDRPALLRDRETQSLVMLGERAVKLIPRYLVRNGVNGVLSQIQLVNDAANGLGVPLPGGRVRVFEPDGTGGDAFTGESAIPHTAAGEKLTVDVGTAFDLAAERREVANKRISDRERELQVEIKLRDRKPSDVTIVVEETVPGDFDVVNESLTSARKDANTLEWQVPVKPGAETVLRYTVRIRY